MRSTTTNLSAWSVISYSASFLVTGILWSEISYAVSPVITINDEAKTVVVKIAKWGGFVLDGALFEPIVYDGVK